MSFSQKNLSQSLLLNPRKDHHLMESIRTITWLRIYQRPLRKKSPFKFKKNNSKRNVIFMFKVTTLVLRLSLIKISQMSIVEWENKVLSL